MRVVVNNHSGDRIKISDFALLVASVFKRYSFFKYQVRNNNESISRIKSIYNYFGIRFN